MGILSLIGNTPMVELENLNGKRPDVRIFAKLEGCNPGDPLRTGPPKRRIAARIRLFHKCLWLHVLRSVTLWQTWSKKSAKTKRTRYKHVTCLRSDFLARFTGLPDG